MFLGRYLCGIKASIRNAIAGKHTTLENYLNK